MQRVFEWWREGFDLAPADLGGRQLIAEGVAKEVDAAEAFAVDLEVVLGG